MFDPKSVRFRGPLVPHVDGFWAELMRRGYTPLSGGNLLRVAAHVSRWLHDRDLGAWALTDERVAQFAADRRRDGYTQFLTPRAVGPLLEYLRELGAAPPPASAPETTVDRFLREYADYLAAERGLAAATIAGYTRLAGRFITERGIDDHEKWGELEPADISRFVLDVARRWSIGTAKHEVTSLRSLLRYVHVRGWIRAVLANCVPAVAGWRLSGLPKALAPDDAARVLDACDLRSSVGRRDAAILRLLLRLGLRAGDVAALTLDDLDWRAGEIVLRGKGRRESRLPLPRDVGESLAAYLRDGRRASSSRRVFICDRAPHAPLNAGSVAAAVQRAMRRAGIVGAAHVLRHTAATQMLRAGASLPEIGHVLRHRHLDTTAIYAKVDFAALRTLAQPWPGGVA